MPLRMKIVGLVLADIVLTVVGVILIGTGNAANIAGGVAMIFVGSRALYFAVKLHRAR